jgi:hypothetical protein
LFLRDNLVSRCMHDVASVISTGTATKYAMLGYDGLRGWFNTGLLENWLGKIVGMTCEWRTELGNGGCKRGGGGLKPDRQLACCMEIALEIFHIEFWQISGNNILIVKMICTWQKWYICWILKFESRNDAGWKNFCHCKGFDWKSIFVLFY